MSSETGVITWKQLQDISGIVTTHVTNYTVQMDLVKFNVRGLSEGSIYLVHLTTLGLLLQVPEESFLCFWEVPVAALSTCSCPPMLLYEVKGGGNVWVSTKNLCVWSRWSSVFQLEMSEISHCDTRKVPGCAAAEVSVCTCPVPAPGLQTARGSHPQSFPGCW